MSNIKINPRKLLIFLVVGLVISLCVSIITLTLEINGFYPNVMVHIYNIFLALFAFFGISMDVYLAILVILGIRKKSLLLF